MGGRGEREMEMKEEDKRVTPPPLWGEVFLASRSSFFFPVSERIPPLRLF